MALRDHLADTRPLRHTDFRRLWWTSIVTVIGGQLTLVVVPAQLWAITRDSVWVGLTGLFGLVPLVVFGLWGGAIADHFDRRRVLQVTNAGLVVTIVLFAAQALSGFHDPWVILWLFALQQAFFAVNGPTRSAIIPSLVAAAELPAANALGIMVFTFGAVVGPMVAGVLIPVLGFGWLYVVDAIGLLFSTFAIWRLPSLRPVGQTTPPGLRSIIDGFGYLGTRPVLLISFVADLIAMGFGMPRVLFPQAANVNFGGPSEGGMVLAVLFAAMPLGALFGTVFSGWVSRVQRQGLAVIVAICVWGGSIIGCGAAIWAARAGHLRPVWLVVAAAMLAAGGAADMASSAFRNTMLQQAAADAVRGRLQGAFLVVVVGGPRLADLLHGGVASTGLDAGLVTALGGVLVVVGTLVCAALTPSFVRYRPGD